MTSYFYANNAINFEIFHLRSGYTDTEKRFSLNVRNIFAQATSVLPSHPAISNYSPPTTPCLQVKPVQTFIFPFYFTQFLFLRLFGSIFPKYTAKSTFNRHYCEHFIQFVQIPEGISVIIKTLTNAAFLKWKKRDNKQIVPYAG